MNRNFILLGLMAIGFANAQEYNPEWDGRVGINTLEPKASLDISKHTGLPENRLQGVSFPNFTSEERAKFENPVLGTMIYNTTKHCLEMYTKKNGVDGWYCENERQMEIISDRADIYSADFSTSPYESQVSERDIKILEQKRNGYSSITYKIKVPYKHFSSGHKFEGKVIESTGAQWDNFHKNAHHIFYDKDTHEYVLPKTIFPNTEEYMGDLRHSYGRQQVNKWANEIYSEDKVIFSGHTLVSVPEQDFDTQDGIILEIIRILSPNEIIDQAYEEIQLLKEGSHIEHLDIPYYSTFLYDTNWCDFPTEVTDMASGIQYTEIYNSNSAQEFVVRKIEDNYGLSIEVANLGRLFRAIDAMNMGETSIRIKTDKNKLYIINIDEYDFLVKRRRCIMPGGGGAS